MAEIVPRWEWRTFASDVPTADAVFAALEPQGSVRHVALMTGLKHYLGPFEDYGTAVMAETPFHESEPRLNNKNFYYAQEDELFAAAERMGSSGSGNGQLSTSSAVRISLPRKMNHQAVSFSPSSGKEMAEMNRRSIGCSGQAARRRWPRLSYPVGL